MEIKKNFIFHEPKEISCKPVMWYIVFDIPYSKWVREQLEKVDHVALHEVSPSVPTGRNCAVLGMGVSGKTEKEAKQTAREILDLAGIAFLRVS
jgi:hypothetical protein